MKMSEVVKARYTCRSYLEEPVSRDLIFDLARAALDAPSADNRQSFRFFLLEKSSSGGYSKIQRIITQDWALDAPWVVFLFAVPDEGYVRHHDAKSFAWVDATIAFDHFILLLTAEGLGSAWTSTADGESLVRALKLPTSWEFIAFTPVGYPADERPKNKLRRRFEEMVLTEPPSITNLLR